MKSFYNRFDIDSSSTQQKQKRFRRRSHSKSPRTPSNRSRDQSLSKFYVKQLNTSTTGQCVEDLLVKKIDTNTNWTPPRVNAFTAKTQSEKKFVLTKQQIIQQHHKQIRNLKEQISKYQVYIKKHNQKLENTVTQNTNLQKQNKKLHQIISDHVKNNLNLQQQIEGLHDKIKQKDILLQFYQKQQSGLKKVKTSIFQARVLEYEKQKQQLHKKIRDLQMELQMQKTAPKQKSSLDSSFKSMTTAPILSSSFSCNFNQVKDYQSTIKQLYEAKQQIKRLQISQSCIQRKFFKQLETLREKKDKQYEQLKKKFTQFLEKYKTNMKKMASLQMANLKQGQHIRNESVVSFSLSSDEERFD